MVAQYAILPGRKLHDQPFKLAVFGDVADAGVATGAAVGPMTREWNFRAVHGDHAGAIIATETIDLVANNSGYDVENEWMYFKAGCYSQNVATQVSDYDQVSFYKLDVTHENMKT